MPAAGRAEGERSERTGRGAIRRSPAGGGRSCLRAKPALPLRRIASRRAAARSRVGDARAQASPPRCPLHGAAPPVSRSPLAGRRLDDWSRTGRGSSAVALACCDGLASAFAGLLAARLVAGPRAAGAVAVERQAGGVERDVGVAAVGVGQLDRRRRCVPLPGGHGAQPAPQRRGWRARPGSGAGRPGGSAARGRARAGRRRVGASRATRPGSPRAGAGRGGARRRGARAARRGCGARAGERRRRSRAPARRARCRGVRRRGAAARRPRRARRGAASASSGRRRAAAAAAGAGPRPAIGSPAASASRPWQRAASASRRAGSGGSGSATVATNAATVASAAATRCSHAARRARRPRLGPAILTSRSRGAGRGRRDGGVGERGARQLRALRALARAAGGSSLTRRRLKYRCVANGAR